jgi:hypothetical protein
MQASLAMVISMICATYGCLHGGEIAYGEAGDIVRIGSVDISYQRVGVLRYDPVDPAGLDPVMVAAVDAYLKATKAPNDLRIRHSKTIGDHVLLVLDQPGVADAGLDLVYAAKEGHIIGWFIGGLRG